MEIEGVGAKTAMVINQVVNVLIAFGIRGKIRLLFIQNRKIK